MFKIISSSSFVLLVVLVVGLQTIEVQSAGQLGDNEIISTFLQLNVYLKSRAKSDELADNLQVLKGLIESEDAKVAKERKSFFGLIFPAGAEKTTVRVAKAVVGLLEVGEMEERSCNQQTLEQLGILYRGHLEQPLRDSDFYAGQQGEARFHLKLFSRLDELLDAKLEIILAKCEPFLGQWTQQQLAKLDQKTSQTIEEVLNETLVENLDDIKHDHRVVLAQLAKRIDFDNYKAALEAPDKAVFSKYYRNLHQKYLGSPCKVFFEHLLHLMEPIERVLQFSKQYQLPLRLPKELILARARNLECYVVNEIEDEQVVSQQAKEIYADFQGDSRRANVKWDGNGRRLY